MRKLWIGGNSFHIAMRVVSDDSPQKHTRNITRAFLAIANDFISAFWMRMVPWFYTCYITVSSRRRDDLNRTTRRKKGRYLSSLSQIALQGSWYFVVQLQDSLASTNFIQESTKKKLIFDTSDRNHTFFIQRSTPHCVHVSVVNSFHTKINKSEKVRVLDIVRALQNPP